MSGLPSSFCPRLSVSLLNAGEASSSANPINKNSSMYHRACLMKGPRPILDDEEVDELTMVVGKSGAPRPIARRLGSEFDEVAPAGALAPDEGPTTWSRPPVNGDTPNGTVPLPSTPTKAPAGTGFQTPATMGDVFSKSAESPYFMDSHTRTPKKSRGGRRINVDTDAEDGDNDYAGRDYADPCEDLAAQVQRSYHHEDDDGAQRIKLTHHISLSKLSKFNGTRNRSERSLRWLKKFIYEMEGTNTPQDHWCDPFQLCMEGGVSNWIRQLPEKTRSKWSRLCKAFMAYYCSQYDLSAEDRRQVTVAEASVDELYDAWQSRLAITPRRRAVSDSGSDYSDRSCKSECESDGDYVETAETGRGKIGGRADGQNRPHGFMGDGRRDEARRPRWGDQDCRARP
ncbi:unnamed protein product [Phytophthora fragariaefolia]|uniref:Unnamed protein product n=1 Tax=Phytophthora fragariaefolia TaxID=1490495 RepID=A0A9W6Y8X2_9STRA|nr:unnamed protein product [Phytophthora fragariaefolia]